MTWRAANPASTSLRARAPKLGGTRVAPATVRIGTVALTHATRVVYPGSGIRKAEVAAYYAAVAHLLLPEIANRPLSLVRCPDGIAGEHFFQRHHAAALGKHVRAVPIVENSGNSARYIRIDDDRGLLELVQMNTLEFHAWGARADAPDNPDRLIFDLDPAPGIAWTHTIAAARDIRARLRLAGLESFVRLTGGKGLHVVAPFVTGPSWNDVKSFCEEFAVALVREHPDVYIATASKARRADRIFVDWLRNVRGATSIAGWSLRARAGAPVAMPLRWEEIGDTASAGAFDLTAALRRAAKLVRDPWAQISTLRQRLPQR